MGGNLVSAWLSDPLIVYALILSGLLFSGIFILFLTIVIKHRQRIKSVRIQHQFIRELEKALECTKEQRDITNEIHKINRLIRLHKKDIAYGWVRLLEKTPQNERQQYINIAKQTEMMHCIPHCLKKEGLAEKCIAIEAIGLTNLAEYQTALVQFTQSPALAPYACIALARLSGRDALPQIIQSYNLGVLSTTQALSALVEIPQKQVEQLMAESGGTALPKSLQEYLVEST